MKRLIYLLPAFALYLASCSDDTITPGNSDELGNENVEQTTLKTANLASFKSSQSRVNVIGGTRAAQPGTLSLFAKIDNLSKEEGKITGFEKEGKDGRYLSATCVYYDKNTGKYYVTYHMQGNNYNTKQTDETSGYIETFTLDAEGKPTVDKVYMSENPSKLDFDFNHLYFDNLTEYNYREAYGVNDKNNMRLIAVGHISEPTKSGKTQTNAIIAQLDLESEKPSIVYSEIYTGDKILDTDGKSLGNEGAGDANCVLRKGDYYFLATRKGFTTLSASGSEDKLFTPFKGLDGKTYFIKTPGSAKYLSHDCAVGSSHMAGLYLTENTPNNYNYDTAIKANIVKFGSYTGWLCGADTSKGGWNIDNATEFAGINWPETTNLPDVSPVDGKNVLFWDGNYIFYAALGKGGLYVHDPNYSPQHIGETITFNGIENASGRPVNAVFVEGRDSNIGHPGTDGFIYVANGGCVTILNRTTLEKIAEVGSAKDEDASANFIQVVNAETETTQGVPDRYVIVAYGQAGVKVFKFIPPTKL